MLKLTCYIHVLHQLLYFIIHYLFFIVVGLYQLLSLYFCLIYFIPVYPQSIYSFDSLSVWFLIHPIFLLSFSLYLSIVFCLLFIVILIELSILYFRFLITLFFPDIPILSYFIPLLVHWLWLSTFYLTRRIMFLMFLMFV